MATLDFSDIIEDEDLGDVFSVIRRVETVSSATGRSSSAETTTAGVTGIVVPGDPGNILRKDDSQMSSNTITITTQYRLRPAGLNVQPDIVLYAGIRYTVKAVKRWTQLGPGFVKAVAESGNAYDPSPV